MKGLTTWLSGNVESLLPSTAAAACITPSEHCQTEVIINRGRPETYHHGKQTGCTQYTPGGCS